MLDILSCCGAYTLLVIDNIGYLLCTAQGVLCASAVFRVWSLFTPATVRPYVCGCTRYVWTYEFHLSVTQWYYLMHVPSISTFLPWFSLLPLKDETLQDPLCYCAWATWNVKSSCPWGQYLIKARAEQADKSYSFFSAETQHFIGFLEDNPGR